MGTSRLSFVKRVGKAMLLIMKRRGLYYLYKLAANFVIPTLAYKLLYGLPKRYLRGLCALIVSITSILIAGVHVRLFGFRKLPIVITTTSFGILASWRVASRLNLYRMRQQARDLTQQAQAAYTLRTFTSWDEFPLDAHVRAAIEDAKRHSPGDFVIGSIDGDGRVLGLFGPLPDLDNVGEADFLERYRYSVDIVLCGDQLVVRKDFRGDTLGFLREWRSLAVLQGKASVPAIYRVDETSCKLYKNLVPGKTIRSILVDAGARILTVQTRDDTELAHLTPQARIEAVWDRGKAVIPQCLPEELLSGLENQLNKIHRCGITGMSLTYGNIIINSKSLMPTFIDFDDARSNMEGWFRHATASTVFFYQRDQDRVKFNKIYGRDLVTERSARQELSLITKKLGGWYAPLDLGGGLATRGFWTTESGTGKWEYLNREVIVPLVRGKRVLDLGSNNGIMPLMMLRNGATQVIGLELSPEYVEAAHLVHRLFEWRNMRKYEFRIHNCDMVDVLSADLGKFDVVTALCTLYYLDPQDMARVTRRVAELAPIFVVQGNVNTRSDAADQKATKSSLEFLKQIMEENGFSQVQVFAPAGYSRPLLIGRLVARTDS